jgi:hypothetical protein
VKKLAVEAMATAMPNWKAKALSAAPAPNFSPKWLSSNELSTVDDV